MDRTNFLIITIFLSIISWLGYRIFFENFKFYEETILENVQMQVDDDRTTSKLLKIVIIYDKGIDLDEETFEYFKNRVQRISSRTIVEILDLSVPGVLRQEPWNYNTNRHNEENYIFLARNIILDENNVLNIFKMLNQTRTQKFSFYGAKSTLINYCWYIKLSNWTLKAEKVFENDDCRVLLGPMLIRYDTYSMLIDHTSLDIWQNWPIMEFFTKKLSDKTYFTCKAEEIYFDNSIEFKTLLDTIKLSKSALINTARNLQVTKIILPDERIYHYSCPQINITCQDHKSLFTKNSIAIPNCCLKEISNCIISYNHLTKINKITSGVACGNLFGSIKFNGGNLPWDTDMDLPILERPENFNEKENLKEKETELQSKMQFLIENYKNDLDKNKINLHILPTVERNVGQISKKFSAFSGSCNHWHLDSYGHDENEFFGSSEKFTNITTKININGKYLPTYWNPGLIQLLHYGPEPWQHVEHTRDKYGAVD